MNKTHEKRWRDIKSKLMAAICMLLVSSIMMVSSTYAWFTLSTAPEVTGINTAVGANGNLEIALLPKDGLTNSITSQAGDSVKDIEAKNITWGNLVDLSDSTIYGLDKITLYPAALNLDTNGKLPASMLKTPTYGADGRVAELLANTFTGYFNKQTSSFTPDSQYGVRAVGTASGMTDRQLDYRNARSNANSARASAANQASASLNNNGSSLANIAIKYGMDGANAKFDKTHVASLRAIINDLKNDGGVLDQMETAYMQYILATAASATTGATDAAWQTVKGAVEASDATLASVQSALTTAGVSLPPELATAIQAYNGIVTDVTAADNALKILETTVQNNDSATFDWEEIKTAMTPLADPTGMLINGFTVSEVKKNLGDLVSSVTTQGGLRVIMSTDHSGDTVKSAGVYAEIADQCGDYTASVNIDRVEYNGIELKNMGAKMETDSGLAPNFYLVAVGAAVEKLGAPAGGAEGTLPITDMYGYVIDMAFRTNAAESNLLLQADAIDRIYDNNTNEDTMGHGSSMTFMATTTDFTNDQVKELMRAIRIIFFDSDSGTIHANAKLDVANATSGTDGWTAEMYLYTSDNAAGTYSPVSYTDNTVTYYTKSTEIKKVYTKVESPVAGDLEDYFVKSGEDYTSAADTVFADTTEYFTESEVPEDKYTQIEDAAASAYDGQLYKLNTSSETVKADNVIMPLTQNTAHKLSVLVYLDGNNMGNDDVAATAATSMKGTMNLQFASSANLVPMDYAALNIPAADAGEATPTPEPTNP